MIYLMLADPASLCILPHSAIPRHRQKTKNPAHPQAGVEKDKDRIVVLAVAVVIVDKLQEFPHLIRLDRFPHDGIVNHNPDQLEIKGILDQQIVIHRHLEGRPENTANRLDRAVPLPVLLQLDQEKLGIRGFYGSDGLNGVPPAPGKAQRGNHHR